MHGTSIFHYPHSHSPCFGHDAETSISKYVWMVKPNFSTKCQNFLPRKTQKIHYLLVGSCVPVGFMCSDALCSSQNWPTIFFLVCCHKLNCSVVLPKPCPYWLPSHKYCFSAKQLKWFLQLYLHNIIIDNGKFSMTQNTLEN